MAASLRLASEGVPFETHIQPTNRPNLFVLTSGQISLSPAEVFEGDAIDQLICKLREKFDFILFDAAPVIDFPDSLALASKVDSIILVTQSEKTSIEDAQRAKMNLEQAGGRILGVVLNRQKRLYAAFSKKIRMIPEALRQKFASGGFPGRDSLLSRPSALRVLQGLTFVVLTLILIPVLSGGLSILILSVPLAGIGAFWLLRHPHWGVWGVLALMTSEIKVLFGASYLLSALLLISLALAIIRDRGCWLLRVPQVQIFLVIGFVFLISTGWSDFKFPITLNPGKDQTVRQAREFLTHLIWLVFFLYFINTRQKIELTAALSVGLILAAALSAGITFVATGGAHRAAASFGLAQNSNRLAYICVFALSLVWFYRSYGSSGAWKLLCLPLLFFLPVVALTAGSRSGLLQIVMLGALILKDQRGWSPAKRIYCVFFMGIVAVLIIALVPAGLPRSRHYFRCRG